MNMISRQDNVGRIPLPLAAGGTRAVADAGAADDFSQAALPGDLDGNGTVDSADRLLMRDLLAENISQNQVVAANADVNEDGWVSGIDGAWLLLLDPPYRGGLISSAFVDSISTIEAEFYLAFAGLGDLRPARYAADMYKLTFRTMTPSGGATTATGLLTLPAGRTGVLPLASYQHGTLTLRTEAPSNPASTEGIGTALVYTSSGGYAAVASDYLGLGDGPGAHPYLHAATEASAGVDMLRAGRTAAAGHGVSLSGPLFLAGYSQGGHATMALHRELEARFTTEWPLTAVAPMAGPYDLSGTMLDYVLGSPDSNNSQLVMYISYLLVMFTTVYDFVPGVAEISSALRRAGGGPLRRHPRQRGDPGRPAAHDRPAAPAGFPRRRPVRTRTTRSARRPGSTTSTTGGRRHRYGCTTAPATPWFRSATPRWRWPG